MRSDQLEDFATRYTAAWCSHDADTVASFFTEDGSIAVNGVNLPSGGQTSRN